ERDALAACCLALGKLGRQRGVGLLVIGADDTAGQEKHAERKKRPGKIHGSTLPAIVAYLTEQMCDSLFIHVWAEDRAPTQERMVPQRFFPASLTGCVRRATGAFARMWHFRSAGESRRLKTPCKVAPWHFLGLPVFATYFSEKCCMSEQNFMIRIVTQIRQ
ncbi:MAG: hypothetical protein ACT6U0_26505, partial [Shinella sp.]